MLSTFQTALELEKTLLQLLAEEAERNAFLTRAMDGQTRWVSLLTEASGTTEAFPVYPEIMADQFVVADPGWMEELGKLQERGLSDGQLLRLGALLGAYTLLVDYYRQAQLNEPHPMTKLFLSSCAEIKRLQKASIEKVYRLVSHDIWKKIGFSPVSNQ